MTYADGLAAGVLEGEAAGADAEGAPWPIARALNALNEFGAESSGGLIANTIPAAQCPV